MSNYDHDLDIQMEEFFFGDIAKDEEYWLEEETENEARDRMTPQEREADEAFEALDPFAEAA